MCVVTDDDYDRWFQTQLPGKDPSATLDPLDGDGWNGWHGKAFVCAAPGPLLCPLTPYVPHSLRRGYGHAAGAAATASPGGCPTCFRCIASFARIADEMAT